MLQVKQVESHDSQISSTGVCPASAHVIQELAVFALFFLEKFREIKSEKRYYYL